MKTDSIFYRLFQALPSTFFELINQPASEASTYQFASVELKQTAFRIDGVFLPLPEASTRPIYFVEIQFQNDPTLYSRLFAEVFLYLRLYEPTKAWRAVVIFAQRSFEPIEVAPYQVLLDSSQVQCLYLDELQDSLDQPLEIQIVQLVVETEAEAPEQARRLLQRAGEEVVDAVLQREIMDLVETIVCYKFPRLSREEIEAMLGLNDLKQTRVYQEALEEGKQEGRLEGKLETIAPLLARGLSVEEIAKVLDLEIEQVRRVAQQ
ncbi:Rpn family recombination-promoting nuclease/putative transposase [Leptolyngbya sp. FACHB-261]|uniref:Rpn family recombination-promoting nuclease/putative transposase n=1 Tax=Leptolyngbya sp. FACHB-261 TaxID=2692806 RepID=UPI001682AA26|nr:Rpn family recombination-promoting nuclease/putative transposase [Leptolyngbya sp. FACHB-261]MBD2101491.1 Rpn family recombination-promoting nuclease/putative transposase [Leptolyngbya sp. FACHB-261]